MSTDLDQAENQMSNMEDIENEGSQTSQESRKRLREEELKNHPSKKIKIDDTNEQTTSIDNSEEKLENNSSTNTLNGQADSINGGITSEAPKRVSSLLEKLKLKLETTNQIVQNINKTKKGGRPKKPKSTTPTSTSKNSNAITPSATTKGSKKSGRKTKKDADFLSHASIEFKSAYTLINRLFNHKSAWPFQAPVDVEGLKLYDYLKIIKKPMDLGTIRTNIQTGKYKNIEEIYNDVNLVVTNCKTYNPPKSDFVIMANDIFDEFLQIWPSVIKSKLNNIDTSLEIEKFEISRGKSSRSKRGRKPTPGVPANIPTPVPTTSTTTTKKTKKESNIPAPSATTTTDASITSRKRGRKPATQDTASSISFHEIKKLSVDLGKLDGEQNNKVLSILKKGSSNAYSEEKEEEIEVDLNKVDVSTFRELQAFVRACLENKPKNAYYVKSAEPINGTGEETDTSSDDDSESSTDDDSSDDENKHISAPISMSSIEKRSSKKRIIKNISNKNRVHFSIEDAVVFKNLRPPTLPIQIVPLEKKEELSHPIIFSPNHSVFDVSKYITFSVNNIEQWKKLSLSDSIVDKSSISLPDRIVLRSIGAQLEVDDVSHRLWKKYRAEFFAKQKREELKQKKLEEERSIGLNIQDDEMKFEFDIITYEDYTEGLADPFGSFM